MNFKEKELAVHSCFVGYTDAITGETIKSGDTMAKFDVKIIPVAY